MLLLIAGGYLMAGGIALAVFDIATKRIRHNLAGSSTAVQQKLLHAGSYVGYRSSSILLIVAIWLLWPVVFIGLLDREGDSSGTQE